MLGTIRQSEKQFSTIIKPPDCPEAHPIIPPELPGIKPSVEHLVILRNLPLAIPPEYLAIKLGYACQFLVHLTLRFLIIGALSILLTPVPVV